MSVRVTVDLFSSSTTCTSDCIWLSLSLLIELVA